MTLTQLEYVLAVNKFRHFGRAAQATFVTQPTLSMQLQKLEEELGVIIFDRSKTPVLPTLEGEAIIRQAAVVIKENKRLLEIAKSGKEGYEGEFRLAVIPTISTYLLPLFVQNFAEKYPKIRLIIEEYKTEDIIRLLGSDEIDAGLLVTPLHDDSLIERVLYYEPFYLFIDPEHQLAKKEKIKQDDLDLNEIWLLNKGNCFRDQVLNICADNKKNPVKDGKIRFESGNLETLKSMVLKTSGYTILPHLAVNVLSPVHKKMIRDFSSPVPTREVSIVYGRSFLKERIINVLEEEILKSIPKELRTLKGKGIEIVEIFQEEN